MSGSGFTILYIVVIMALLYFMMIRPQKKQLSARNDMLKSLKKGDHVSTVGGINGYIRAIKEGVVYLEIADGLIIEVMKASISGVIDEAIYEDALEDVEASVEEIEVETEVDEENKN